MVIFRNGEYERENHLTSTRTLFSFNKWLYGKEIRGSKFMDKSEIFHYHILKYGGIYLLDKNSDDIYISDLLEDSNKIINGLISKNNKLPSVYIGIINNQNTNACAFSKNNQYYIGIMKGTINKYKEFIDSYMDNLKGKTLRILKQDNIENYKAIFLLYAVRFTIFHEYGHIVNGHCNFKKSINKYDFNFEISNADYSNSKNIDSQTREMDADTFSIKKCIDQIFTSEELKCLEKYGIKDYSIDELLICLSCSTYIMFSVFTKSKYDLTKLENNSHPPLGIRQTHTITSTLIEYIYDVWNFDMNIQKFMNDFRGDFEIITILSDLQKKDSTLMIIAYSNEGKEHMHKILNNWENIRQELLPFSHVELDPTL